MCKIILSIFGLLQITSIYSQSVSNISDSLLQEVQDEIFYTTYMHDGPVKETPAEQNVQFVPISTAICANTIQFKYYHDKGLRMFYFEKFMEHSYALGNLVDILQNSTNVKLKVNNALFYKHEDSSENLLNDLQARYHSELYNTSFDSKDNESVLAAVNEWISKNTKGRGQKIENLSTSGKVLIYASVLSFTGCWDTLKSSNSINSLNFKTVNAEMKLNTFNGREIVAYLNNSEDKYEAIRIPFKNHEFAAVVVLPHPDQPLESLEIFKNTRLRQLFEHLGNNESETNVDYTIPILNSPMISFNENGSSVNGDDFIACDSSSPNQQQQLSSTNTTDYKRFYVDRPFGIFVYHEKTKIILVNTLVKNPSSAFTTLGTLEMRETWVIMEANVDYTIPILNSPTISFNENGTSVNGDDFIVCDSSSPNQQQLSSTNTTDYKRFYVGRPFGIFIYHEESKIILVHTLVKNPTSVLTTLDTFKEQGFPNLRKSANLYEFLLA